MTNATAAINVWSAEDGHFDAYGKPEWQFARLPSVDEYISIGKDDGSELALRVIRVVHCPEGHGDVDAELFTVHALSEEILAAPSAPATRR